MIFKVVTIAVVLFLVYVIFFKKNRENSMKNNDKSGKYDEITDTLVECPTCNVYVSKDDAILSSGKYFCANGCIK